MAENVLLFMVVFGMGLSVIWAAISGRAKHKQISKEARRSEKVREKEAQAWADRPRTNAEFDARLQDLIDRTD